MWKAAVFVFLLLSMDLKVKGAVDKSRRCVNLRSEKKEKTEEAKDTNLPPSSGTTSSGFLGKLLVVPMDGSHWVGIKALAQEMGRRGHQVTVVMPEVSMEMGPGKHYDTVFYPVPYDKTFIDSILASNMDLFQRSTMSLMEKMSKQYEQIMKIRELFHTTAESLLFNSSLISHLAQQGFHAVLTDPMVPTGSYIARKLGLPSVNLLRAIPCMMDMKAAGCPSLPSYVPRLFTGYTDKMNFKARTVNTLAALLEPLMCRLLYWHFDHIAYQFLGEEVGIVEVLSDSAVWLLRTDLWGLEFPHPLMPNVILVGGINCDVTNPLPEDLAAWVSGEHGFVVFTLGSMLSDMPEEKTSVFLEAFRQIPQKVIWRYTGKVPSSVPENVKIMEWVPQNDLLAHPGARAFITHAGLHGIFEGLCHAVPMVMLPILADQPENAQRMAIKGAGVVLDITSVTTENLLQALNDVINNNRYKENVKKLSVLHKDRPIDPLNLSVYWTEFVMRHKGAKHLKPAVHNLNWIQFFCLDVIALLATVLILVILTVKCFTICLGKLGEKKKQD